MKKKNIVLAIMALLCFSGDLFAPKANTVFLQSAAEQPKNKIYFVGEVCPSGLGYGGQLSVSADNYQKTLPVYFQGEFLYIGEEKFQRVLKEEN